MEKIEVDPKLFITCRLCLEDLGVYQIIPIIQQKIKYCFDIDVAPFDSLPQLICKTCESKLSEYYQLKTVLIEKQTLLKSKEYKQDLNKIVEPVSSSSENVNEQTEQPDFTPIIPDPKEIKVDSVIEKTTEEKRPIKRRFTFPVSDSESEVSKTLPEKKRRRNTNSWRKKYETHFVCRICSTSFLKRSSLLKHYSRRHSYMQKYAHIINSFCVVDLNKIDNRPNITGNLNTVVLNKDNIVRSDMNNKYFILYQMKNKQEAAPINKSLINELSSDSSDDIIISDKMKNRKNKYRLLSTDTVVIDKQDNDSRLTFENEDESRINTVSNHQLDTSECINLDSESDTTEPVLIRHASKTYNNIDTEPSDSTDLKFIRNIIEVCHSRHVKKKRFPDSSGNVKSYPEIEAQLKHKILSLGRKVVNKQGLNCAGLLRFMEYRNLGIRWIPRASDNNVSHIRMNITKLRKDDVHTDDSDVGWTNIKPSAHTQFDASSGGPSTIEYNQRNTIVNKVTTSEGTISRNSLENLQEKVNPTVHKSQENITPTIKDLNKSQEQVNSIDKDVNKYQEKVNPTSKTPENNNYTSKDLIKYQEKGNSTSKDLIKSQEKVNPTSEDLNKYQEKVNSKSKDSNISQEITNPKVKESNKSQEKVDPTIKDLNKSQNEVNPTSKDLNKYQEKVNSKSKDSNISQEKTNPKVKESNKSQEKVDPTIKDSNKSQEKVNSTSNDSNISQEKTNPKVKDSNISLEKTDPKVKDTNKCEENINLTFKYSNQAVLYKNNDSDINPNGKLLNASPVENPKQLPKSVHQYGAKTNKNKIETNTIQIESNDRTILIELGNEESFDTNLCMPIITATTSLATTSELTQIEKDQIKNKGQEENNLVTTHQNNAEVPHMPRIKVKPVAELMADKNTRSTDLLINSSGQKVWQPNQSLQPVNISTQNNVINFFPNLVLTPVTMQPVPMQLQTSNVTSGPASGCNLTETNNTEYIVLNTVEMPNAKTNSPFVYLQRLLHMHNISVSDTIPLAKEILLIKFRVLFKQDNVNPVVLCLTLYYSYIKKFRLSIKDEHNKFIRMQEMSVNWQWEIMKIYQGDVSKKILENAIKTGLQVHEDTKTFICLLKSINRVLE